MYHHVHPYPMFPHVQYKSQKKCPYLLIRVLSTYSVATQWLLSSYSVATAHAYVVTVTSYLHTYVYSAYTVKYS